MPVLSPEQLKWLRLACVVYAYKFPVDITKGGARNDRRIFQDPNWREGIEGCLYYNIYTNAEFPTSYEQLVSPVYELLEAKLKAYFESGKMNESFKQAYEMWQKYNEISKQKIERKKELRRYKERGLPPPKTPIARDPRSPASIKPVLDITTTGFITKEQFIDFIIKNNLLTSEEIFKVADFPGTKVTTEQKFLAFEQPTEEGHHLARLKQDPFKSSGAPLNLPEDYDLRELNLAILEREEAFYKLTPEQQNVPSQLRTEILQLRNKLRAVYKEYWYKVVVPSIVEGLEQGKYDPWLTRLEKYKEQLPEATKLHDKYYTFWNTMRTREKEREKDAPPFSLPIGEMGKSYVGKDVPSVAKDILGLENEDIENPYRKKKVQKDINKMILELPETQTADFSDIDVEDLIDKLEPKALSRHRTIYAEQLEFAFAPFKQQYQQAIKDAEKDLDLVDLLGEFYDTGLVYPLLDEVFEQVSPPEQEELPLAANSINRLVVVGNSLDVKGLFGLSNCIDNILEDLVKDTGD